jgi:hypothetical protein
MKAMQALPLCVAMTTLWTPMPPAAAAADQAAPQSSHVMTVPGPTSTLVQQVRDATGRYLDVRNAAPDYGPFLGCVTGPDEGAMGVHFVNLALVMDQGALDIAHPEALIYEPMRDGYRLVGVEYIVPAADWHAHDPLPPTLGGQSFQFVDSPNRFGLPPFYELHVWAWRDNPHGAFVDWNTHVSCEHQ